MSVTFSIALVLSFQLAKSVNHCETPNGQHGECKPINHCPSVYSFFSQKQPFSNTTATFIRKSHCGSEGIYPKVCCPIGSAIPPPDKPNESGDIKKLLPEECGNSLQNRIFGGEVTNLDEFPWMALLDYEYRGNRTPGCGGSLISKRYVLTAKHCIKDNLVSVRLGEYDIRTDPDCIVSSLGKDCAPKVLKVDIEEKISYNGRADIALLRLNQDIEFNDFIKPICLPFSVENLSNLGERLLVSGWGLTEKNKSVPSDVKLKVDVPIKPLSECTNALKKIFNLNLELGEGHLCAGGEEGKDSCNRDSGGPLMGVSLNKQKDQQWYVVGVVSLGPTNPCGRKDKPAVYVRVSKYVDWIVKNLKP